MARSNFSGKNNGKWHVGPTMYASGYIDGERSGGTISGTVHAAASRSSGSYNYPVYVKVYCNGNEIASKTCYGNGNFDETFGWSVNTNDACTIWVIYICGQTGGCSGGGQDIWNGGENAGVYGKDGYLHKVNGLSGGSLSFSSYNPNTPATNVARGKVYTTNNTNPGYGATVSDKPDLQIWFDWWGQADGKGNPISYFNVDIKKNSNDSSGASSYPSTDHYIQNTKLSLFEMCRHYDAKVGDTLYCWVNTYVGGATNNWLGRVYLGAVEIVQDGIVYYKDGSGAVHVCTTGYSKDTSGSNYKARYVQVKDTSGAAHNIDVYTTLYE